MAAVKNFSAKRWLAWVLIASPIFYIGACTLISKMGSRAFEAIKDGNTEDAVIQKFGTPSHIETPDELYSRYASYKCKMPCVKRLWFENKLSIGMEAWSVEIDSDKKVVEKAYWMSP